MRRDSDEMLIALSSSEYFKHDQPVTVRGEPVSHAWLRDRLAERLHREVLTWGVPPMRFAESWCAAHGVAVNRAVLEWIVIDIALEHGMEVLDYVRTLTGRQIRKQ